MASKSLIVFVFVLSLIFGSCNKDQVLTVDVQKALLIGKDSNGQKWKLVLISIDGVVQPLDYAQQKMYKIYSANSNFFNSDGYYGIWDMPELDVLNEFYTFSNGTYTKNQFKITYLTEDTLVLKYDYNGKVVVTTYKVGI